MPPHLVVADSGQRFLEADGTDVTLGSSAVLGVRLCTDSVDEQLQVRLAFDSEGVATAEEQTTTPEPA